AAAGVEGVSFLQPSGPPLAAGEPCTGEPCVEPAVRWDVSWKSGPETWTPLPVPPAHAGGEVLLRTEQGIPLLVASGRTVVVAFETPKAMLGWPYFNYVLHAAGMEATGRAAAPFAEWPGAPVPQERARLIYAVSVPIAWAIFFFLYRIARRRGRARPGAASEFFAAIEATAERKKKGGAQAGGDGWNRAGFARPLGGYLTLVAAMSFVVGSYLVLQWFFNSEVQPFPEAVGLWETPWQTLIIVALLFEMGTNDASVKYFAEDRVARPADALANFQFYIWWAFFQRLMQTTLVGAAAIFLVPHWRDYAIFSIFALLFAFKGLPSIAPLGRFVATGLQRFDVQSILDLLESKILRYLAPIPFVLAGRAWGAGHPQYGEIFGAAIGLALGYLAMTLLTLALGFAALRLMGVPIRTLFLAQFDWRLVTRQFLFGGKIALGAEPIFLVNAIEAVVITVYFTNFTAWQGIEDLLMVKMLMLFQFAGPFYNGVVSAVSEAYSAGKRALTRYYVARFFQFGYLFHATIYSLMLALGQVWIAALGHQYERAIEFLPLTLVYGLLWPAVFTSDNALKGAGRPLTLLALMYIEYGVRIGLIVVLVPVMGFMGLVVAGLSATALKAVLSWAVNHRTLVPFHISVRSALVAPAIAGLANYLLWLGVLTAWAPSSVPGVLALMCVAAGLSFLVTFFVAGLAGGYDREALAELDDATEMTSMPLRLVAAALTAAARAGARLCPVEVRPLPYTREALAEADDLTDAEHMATGETSRPGLAPG
ncbi:MAG TPA: hypothetical protein VFU21_05180, partial [Kofleriaceae bacterium]|nr:hypothetical protein [Kofleriaceae bacterium]